MILKRLTINRLPGVSKPFEIKAAGPGIHVIFGPNGIGKSSIGRAVEGLYWSDRGSSHKTSVSGVFEWGGDTWRGERQGPNGHWRRGGEGNASPSLPPSHNYRCFFLNLRDLVDPSLEGTEDIASEIRRQTAGGFDLHDIGSGLFSPVTPHTKRQGRRSFNAARDNVQKEEGKQHDLQRRVDRLDHFKDKLEEAKAAASRIAHVERAIGLAGRRGELSGIEEQLAALPGALARLTGQERENVRKHEEGLTQLEERARKLERELQEAREERKKSGLADPLEKADLATWRDNADELGRIEQTLEAARTEREKARNRLASSLAAIGGEDVDHAQLSLPDRRKLFEFLRASHSHKTQVHAIREQLGVLKSADPTRNGEHDIEKIRSAAAALRSWLRVPQTESPAIRLRRRWPWLLLAIAIFLAGAALAYLVDPLLALIAAVGPGISLAALFPGGESGFKRKRQEEQERYKQLGLEEPVQWYASSVESALLRLESKISALERARDRDVERKRLEQQLKDLAEGESDLEIRRQDLKAALGLKSLPPDAELVDFARALDDLRLARREHEASTGEVERQESRHTGLLAQLADTLERYGEPRPAGAAEARARVNNLVDRNSRLETALYGERNAKPRLDQNAHDRDSIRALIDGIYATAGLDAGDAGGLASLLEKLPQHRKLTRRKDKLESQIESDREELDRVGESELSEQDSQSLERLKSELSKAASQESQLHKEIAEVNAEVKQTRDGADMQNLIAVREETRARLREVRDAALFAKAGKFLIEEVEQEYEQSRMPRVFERARDHFSRFTFLNYELQLEKGKGIPRLFAVESRGGQRREIDELSDGTRAQLLLAARIAFAEEVEQGKVLPLFLDEALDQSDPQRFEAIVRSLGRIAHEQGRQIFYLTSDPLDVDRIRHALSRDGREPAEPIDLGLIRTGAESVSGPEALRVPPAPKVPAPDGLTPEAYGALLRVPAFRPALGFAEQHVFYVLWDDLALLRDALTSAIEWAGQWKTVTGTALAERLASRSIAATQVGLRLDLLEVFCELWKQGRGKPMGRDALTDSGALSGRYRDDVVEIARELDGDPERLLGELTSRKDQRLKGFRSNSVEQLRNYLIENEYLDDRPVLAESELRLRCMASPAANHLSDGVATECVRRWWEWAGKSLSSGPKSRPE